MARRIVTGTELLRDIARGVTDFRGIELREGNLTNDSKYADVVNYTQNKFCDDVDYDGGLIFTGANLTGLRAPAMSFRGANFDGATLANVRVDTALFDYCNMNGVNINSMKLRNGSLSCSMLEDARVRNLDLFESQVFETGFGKSVILGVKGIDTSTKFQTSMLKDTIVDAETYKQIQRVFPKHSPLVARDVPVGTVLEDGTVVPEGSMILNTDYYLIAWHKKAGLSPKGRDSHQDGGRFGERFY